MTQLILDVDGAAIVLPESIKGGYTAVKEPLADTVEMISGRIVREVRGNRWVVSYQYGYFDENTMRQILTVCDKGIRQAIKCSFLPQESTDGTLTTLDFFVASYNRPRFMWSDNLTPLWADFSVNLRAVNPVD